jgi:protein-L-isoaspartate(D-aspartate) O-methyltransferase
MGDYSQHNYISARKRLVQQLREEGIQDELVLSAMEKIPRHLFMEQSNHYRAYEDTALPIEFGQTISQPYIVAQMTSALCRGKKLQAVLEIGTGSGYQAAVLSQIAEKVYTVERIEALAKQAAIRFEALGFNNIQVIYGDGYQGWVKAAPYPAIIVTAAPPEIPDPLLNQLDEGGRMVIPVGELGDQQLILVTRIQNHFHQKPLERVRFVPMVSSLDNRH